MKLGSSIGRTTMKLNAQTRPSVKTTRRTARPALDAAQHRGRERRRNRDTEANRQHHVQNDAKPDSDRRIIQPRQKRRCNPARHGRARSTGQRRISRHPADLRRAARQTSQNADTQYVSCAHSPCPLLWRAQATDRVAPRSLIYNKCAEMNFILFTKNCKHHGRHRTLTKNRYNVPKKAFRCVAISVAANPAVGWVGAVSGILPAAGHAPRRWPRRSATAWQPSPAPAACCSALPSRPWQVRPGQERVPVPR